MTHDELNAMTDRALDALVAERVMGWTKPELLEKVINDHRLAPPGQPKYWTIPPRYSTDMNAAMQVVEKMRPTHWYALYNHDPNGDYEAVIHRRKKVREFSATHANPARAICIAALLALGVAE